MLRKASLRQEQFESLAPGPRLAQGQAVALSDRVPGVEAPRRAGRSHEPYETV